MRPQLLKVNRPPEHSFTIRKDLIASANARWHFHPEVELIHIRKGRGTQFIGDHMKQFGPGDILLIGSNLPHHWRFEDAVSEAYTGVPVDLRVIHFSENFCGETFLHLPETSHLNALLKKAKRGLQVTGEARKKVAGLMDKLLEAEGMHRILLLMEALDSIAVSEDVVPLSSIGFRHQHPEGEYQRINTIYEYCLKHFRRPIQLEEISRIANISPNSFCRFFKSRTQKTFSRFLLEIRVGHACKLLIENNLSIKQLCYDSGFNNFASFYKYFKLITGKSPLAYQEEFTAAAPANERPGRKRRKSRNNDLLIS